MKEALPAKLESVFLYLLHNAILAFKYLVLGVWYTIGLHYISCVFDGVVALGDFFYILLYLRTVSDFKQVLAFIVYFM